MSTSGTPLNTYIGLPSEASRWARVKAGLAFTLISLVGCRLSIKRLAPGAGHARAPERPAPQALLQQSAEPDDRRGVVGRGGVLKHQCHAHSRLTSGHGADTLLPA